MQTIQTKQATPTKHVLNQNTKTIEDKRANTTNKPITPNTQHTQNKQNTQFKQSSQSKHKQQHKRGIPTKRQTK